MPNSIFINENFFNMSDPQPGLLFHVFFYKTTGTSKIDDDHLIAETATLPKFETTTVTKKYFGSEKTFPIVRNYGTDISFRFTVRAEPSDNNQLYSIAQINSRCLKDLMASDGVNYNKSTIYPVHPEHEIYSSRVGTKEYITVDKIIVMLKDRTGEANQASNFNGEFHFENCVLKNLDFESDLDYNNEDVVKCKLTFHSDIWTYHINKREPSGNLKIVPQKQSFDNGAFALAKTPNDF